MPKRSRLGRVLPRLPDEPTCVSTGFLKAVFQLNPKETDANAMRLISTLRKALLGYSTTQKPRTGTAVALRSIAAFSRVGQLAVR